MNYEKMSQFVYDIANELASRGAGWAQQGAVLAEVANRLNGNRDIRTQQFILTCWHDLFRQGRLSWGYNLDNPNAPFFHVPQWDGHREKVTAEPLRAEPQ